ncbi:Biotin carboxylase [Rhodovulum sp. ES.010]|uniref:ATP-grasp domain-containing protein n=1 Tax=Rhodovulum sp. ES.010 TaxID=1882821 RepID=UPI0009292DC1|nr:ATP-grasp domain-containing protein [Rhodovulum sp. ES.010]SIO12495.1 Biotin carboxylase [Rhodovulum sp. ES.010]
MDAERKTNIFVAGLDPFNLRLLQSVRRADRYAFHPLYELEEITYAPSFDIEALLDKGRAILRDFDGPVDAIVGYWDFPSIVMLPILRREIGLPGPSLESVLRCQHKYWSRREQAGAVPETVPRFALVDPFEADAGDPPLPYPFWIKPVTSHSSILGFRVRNRADYAHALSEMRAGIHRFAGPLEVLMGYADLPDEIAAAGAAQCIAEEIISTGRQCTLEGYVFEGETTVYGIVDSIRGRNRSSLERYEYPSALPEPVKARMRSYAATVLERIGLDDTPFNMEFFYQARDKRLSLLEINARISKSHSPIFDKVEGVPHKEVMIDVALGRRPEFPARRGAYRYAAKFMPRLYGHSDDEIVTHAPSEAEVRALEARYPGTDIKMHVDQGMRLRDDHHYDEYSHELAAIFMGADSRDALHANFRRLFDEMDIRTARPGRTPQ